MGSYDAAGACQCAIELETNHHRVKKPVLDMN